jgi:hypothetical protein
VSPLYMCMVSHLPENQIDVWTRLTDDKNQTRTYVGGCSTMLWNEANGTVAKCYLGASFL